MELQQFNLPLEVFENQPEARRVINPNIFLMEDFNVDDGIRVLVRGNKYHFKGMPYPQVVDAVMATKRMAINGLRVFSGVGILYLLLFRGRIIKAFTDYTDLLLRGYYLKPQFYCRSAREVYRVGMKIAGDNLAYQLLAKWAREVWQNDDGYRYRFQDAFSEAKSFIKGIGLFLEREVLNNGTRNEKWAKIIRMFRFFKFFLWNFARKVDKETNWKELEMDTEDKYHAFVKDNYRFGGRSREENLKIRETL